MHMNRFVLRRKLESFHTPGGVEHDQQSHAGEGGEPEFGEKEYNLAGNHLYNYMRDFHNENNEETKQRLLDFVTSQTGDMLYSEREMAAIRRASRDTLNDLPWKDGKVKLYRGGTEKSSGGFTSWTTDPEWAKRFAVYGFGGKNSRGNTKGAGKIHEREFTREELILALPWEGEVLVKNQ